jgi:hypothetical protein
VDAGDDPVRITLEWTPQRTVWRALWISLAGVLACVGIAAVGWWRARRARRGVRLPMPGDADVVLEWPALAPALGRRARVVVPIVAGVLGAIVAAPWIGVVVGLGVALAVRVRWARVVLAIAPAVLVAGAGAYIAIWQVRYDVPPIFEWPTVFPRARTLAWFALVLVVSGALIDVARRAHGRRAEEGR